jgi:hypothetical protein
VNFLRDPFAGWAAYFFFFGAAFFFAGAFAAFLVAFFIDRFSLTSNLRSLRDHSCDPYIRLFAGKVKKKIDQTGRAKSSLEAKTFRSCFVFGAGTRDRVEVRRTPLLASW